MRWSLFYLFAILTAASTLDGILAAPTPAGDKLTSSALKKSSSTYRKAATQNPHTYGVSSGRIQKSQTPSHPPKGKDADHILEAQTVAKALQRAGHTSKSGLGPGLNAAKDALNHPNNMAFVDPGVNRAKGQAHKSALGGGHPTPNPLVQSYMKQTSTQGKSAAKQVDAALKQHGIKGVNVSKEHRDALKRMGIKRRELIRRFVELELEDLD